MKLGKYQAVDLAKSFASQLSTRNHISMLSGSNPQKFSSDMVKILAYNQGATFETILEGMPIKEFERDDEFYWDVLAPTNRSITLIEARDEDGNVVTKATQKNIGVNTAPFHLVFGEGYFFDGEVIMGAFNEAYPLRILGEPKNEGTNFVYKVELMGGVTGGMPAERLLLGEKFSYQYAPVERELSRKVGGIRISTPSLAMRNEFSHIRIFHKVTGRAMLDSKMAIGFPVVDTKSGRPVEKVVHHWIHLVEYELEKQFREAKNNVLLRGTSNRDANNDYQNTGKSGMKISMGAGLREQMRAGNIIYYNATGEDFPLALVEGAIMDLFRGTKESTSPKKVIMMTGIQGAIQFHKAITKMVSGWGTILLNNAPSAIEKTTSNMHKNSLAAGFQFTEYNTPFGVTLTVKVDPAYDNEEHNKILHPVTNFPAMSYQYDIMDLGDKSQPNIYKCTVKSLPETRSYQAGPTNPFFGQVNNVHMSYDEDSASIHRIATLGLAVLDPTRTMSIIPNYLQY